MVFETKPVRITELAKETEQYLLQKGCKKSTLGVYKATWHKFMAFSSSDVYSRTAAEDFLKLYLSKLFSGNFCVIGNYPYNISSQIFFKVLEYKDHIPCCSGMIQKEVAERMAAPPGSKTYSILSVLLQAWYEIEYLFTVPEHVFNPPPKVKSAVIKMTRNQVRQLGCNEPLFKRIVKTAFNQRRKTMRNSLKSMVGQDCKILAEPIFN